MKGNKEKEWKKKGKKEEERKEDRKKIKKKEKKEGERKKKEKKKFNISHLPNEPRKYFIIRWKAWLLDIF